MSGPARAGVLVYAKDIERLAAFYETVAGMARLHATDELVVPQSPDMQLLVHRIPAHIAEGIVAASPPVRRADCAIKFFFTAASMVEASASVSRLGGTVFAEQWDGPGFVVNNACDPEGNVCQVRQGVR